MSDPASSEESLESLQKDIAAAMAEIGRMHMPFGKFGPQSHPPHGVPLYDLPVEYLLWFKQKGFPKGILGDQLQLMLEIKVNGLEDLIYPLIKKN